MTFRKRHISKLGILDEKLKMQDIQACKDNFTINNALLIFQFHKSGCILTNFTLIVESMFSTQSRTHPMIFIVVTTASRHENKAVSNYATTWSSTFKRV